MFSLCHIFKVFIKYNSLHLGRKYARIFVLGHHLFLEAHSFPRAMLELSENCSLLGTIIFSGFNAYIDVFLLCSLDIPSPQGSKRVRSGYQINPGLADWASVNFYFSSISNYLVKFQLCLFFTSCLFDHDFEMINGKLHKTLVVKRLF